jgi:hypothetical protein
VAVAAFAMPLTAKTKIATRTKSFKNFLLNPNSSFQYEHTQEKNLGHILLKPFARVRRGGKPGTGPFKRTSNLFPHPYPILFDPSPLR